MKSIRVLNLYSCLGGNRYKWDEVADIEVTAVEWDEDLAKLYKERFPNDTVVVGDAHQYLLDHYKEFDFIWTSPPCPTHSRARFWCSVSDKTVNKPAFPDLKLYEEILFLQHWFKGKYVVENVIPYYSPLIPGAKRGRHLYWSNFRLPNVVSNRKPIGWHKKMHDTEIEMWNKFHDYNFYKYQGKQRRDKIARNLVDYEAGKTIFEFAANTILKKPAQQIGLFA